MSRCGIRFESLIHALPTPHLILLFWRPSARWSAPASMDAISEARAAATSEGSIASEADEAMAIKEPRNEFSEL